MIFDMRKWLDEFFRFRGLKGPDGRSLFAYHVRPEEYRELKDGLRRNVEAIRLFPDDPLASWSKNEVFPALFALYASTCWQQDYDGRQWRYDIIINPLGLSREQGFDYSSLIGIIEAGLAFWGLKVNEGQDHKYYLGSIAREAGLPQRLLSDKRGNIGHILHSVLREALKGQANPSLIRAWVESYRDLLPKSICKTNEILSLLADSVAAIVDLKKHINSRTLEEALKELDEKKPQWKAVFPLPLYDSAADRLLESLVGEAIADSGSQARGSRISAQRRLIKTGEQWELEARIELSKKIRVDWNGDSPRMLSLQIIAGDKKYVYPIRKLPDQDLYICAADDCVFSGQNAASEITAQFRSATGASKIVNCPGGFELDEDLPWIFEGPDYDYCFRQQGGGGVHGKRIFAALPHGWHAENGEKAGSLPELGRELFLIEDRGILKKGELAFTVKARDMRSEAYDWSGSNRFLAFESISPSFAYRGLPRPVTGENVKLKQIPGELLWQSQAGKEFLPCQDSSDLVGVYNIWFRAESGANLRNRMLLLPENAELSLSAGEAGKASIRLKNWCAATAALASGQSSISLRCEADDDDLMLELEAEDLPPTTVDLDVYWKDSPRPARIRLPFPQKSARLFIGDREIAREQTLCASCLYGMRLHCMAFGARRMSLRLSSSRFIEEYPLANDENGIIINLVDWQNTILEMLALKTGIDESVFLDICFDNKKMSSWRFLRYNLNLVPEGGAVFLSSPEYAGGNLKRCELKAMLLSRPEKEPVNLPEAGAWGSCPRWEVTKVLDESGPWLVFEDELGTTLRPLLWNETEKPCAACANRLQAAIAERAAEKRAEAFEKCVAEMEAGLDAPEWESLLALFKRTRNLPLSTLEVWKFLIRSPAVMALIALHPGIDFDGTISRVDTELPFLWHSVSRRDWKNAGKQILSYYERILPEGINARSIWEEHLRQRLLEMGAAKPDIHYVLHLSFALPWYERGRQALKEFYSPDQVDWELFAGEKSGMQELMRRHLEEDWPEYFRPHFDELLTRLPALARFMKRWPDDYRQSVVGLPIALTLRAWLDPASLRKAFNDPDFIFNTRTHLRFDEKWFEEAARLTAFACLHDDI